MTQTQPTLLTRAIGIQNLTTPTGRTLSAVKYLANPNLLKIAYVDGKGGTLPDNLTGLYTNSKTACADITKYVTEFWDISDEQAFKNAKK